MNTLSKTIIISIAVAFASSAFAAPAKNGNRPDVTQAEFIQSAEKRFDAFDMNKDGKLSKKELASVNSNGKGFASMLKVGETKSQMLNKAQDLFAKLDSNHDGVISKEERRANAELNSTTPESD